MYLKQNAKYRSETKDTNSILRRINWLNVEISYYKCKNEIIYSIRVWLYQYLYLFKILTFQS